MPHDLATHELRMRAAIAEAEVARGSTGDNPWVGCVIADATGRIVARGHTQGPGEDHAEIVAMRRARAVHATFSDVTLYSTLEPCSFHGRTPACARAVIDAGVRRVVIGVLDPNPRVDGVGLQILREAGVVVVEDVCAREVRHQLADWLLLHHPHEAERAARALLASHGGSVAAITPRIAERYGIDVVRARTIVERATEPPAV